MSKSAIFGELGICPDDETAEAEAETLAELDKQLEKTLEDGPDFLKFRRYRATDHLHYT